MKFIGDIIHKFSLIKNSIQLHSRKVLIATLALLICALLCSGSYLIIQNKDEIKTYSIKVYSRLKDSLKSKDKVKQEHFSEKDEIKKNIEDTVNEYIKDYKSNKPEIDIIVIVDKKKGKLIILKVLKEYPIGYGKNPDGLSKQSSGDNRTPEGSFKIRSIERADHWRDPFEDRLAYGPYFIRLSTPPFSGIGIHGSGENPQPKAGYKVSHGCIRMSNEDINDVIKFIKNGTKVHIISNFSIYQNKEIYYSRYKRQNINLRYLIY